MRYTAKAHVRWDDLDAFGHVNNASYLTFAQEARAEFTWFARVRAGLEPLSEMVVARAEVDLILQIYEGGMDIDCEMWFTKIGNSSFVMAYELKSDKGIHARVQTVQVTVDAASKKSRPINAAEREFLEQYLEA